jgi:putative transposase
MKIHSRSERSIRAAVRAVSQLKGLLEVENIVFDWVSWYNNDRLHSFLGNIPPEAYERAYYARTIGPSKGDAANKPAA